MTESQAEKDAQKAHMFGVAAVLREDRPGAAVPMTRDEITDDYARSLLDDLSGESGPERMYAAARVACIDAADEVAYPARWRQAIRAVELCQRAAELAAGAATDTPS